MNFFNASSSIFPDLELSNFPPLNNANVGYPETLYSSIRSFNSSPLTFTKVKLVSSLETFANYKIKKTKIMKNISYNWSLCFARTTPSSKEISNN
jgi:hypothetical protein